jgi:hypothetical protein
VRYLRSHYMVGSIIMVTGSGELVDRVVGLKSAPTTTYQATLTRASCWLWGESVMRRLQARAPADKPAQKQSTSQPFESAAAA